MGKFHLPPLVCGFFRFENYPKPSFIVGISAVSAWKIKCPPSSFFFEEEGGKYIRLRS